MNNDQQQRWVTRARAVATAILLAKAELDALYIEYTGQDLGTTLSDPPPGHEVDKADCVNLISTVKPALDTLVTNNNTTLQELRNMQSHL